MYHRNVIDYLVEWKKREGRKPLILRGARQVGKTSAALMFAEKNFENTVYINLENIEHLRLFREDLSVDDFIKIVQIKFKQEIVPGKTIIFLDEIQESPSLIKLLRFFYELIPEVHVIAAGSLLEAMIEKEGLSLPVGRVEFAYVYPFDFFEFLNAKGEKFLLDFLKKVSIGDNIPEGVHSEALSLFYEYTMLGGMPEILKTYLEKGSIAECQRIYSELITGYSEDVYKYSSRAEAKYLRYVIEKAPLFAGGCIKYENFGGSTFRSREIGRAFDVLEKVMLLHQIYATKDIEIPLIKQPKRAKKLLFLDVGLVNYEMGVQGDFINIKDLNDLYGGKIAEQVVGQNILAQFVDLPPKVLYWARNKQEGSAEVDFCLLDNTKKILGIEVKSGTTNKLKSLFSFGQKVKNHSLMRIYGGSFKMENIKIGTKHVKLISIPFYLVPRLLELTVE